MTNELNEALKSPMADLDRLIKESGDPNMRAFILAMRAVTTELIQSAAENTKAIEDVGAKIDAHLKIYQAQSQEIQSWKNQGLGMWKILGYAMVLVQALVVWGGNFILEEAQQVRLDIATLKKDSETAASNTHQLARELEAIKPKYRVGTPPRDRR